MPATSSVTSIVTSGLVQMAALVFFLLVLAAAIAVYVFTRRSRHGLHDAEVIFDLKDGRGDER
jgi:hypothetical protein